MSNEINLAEPQTIVMPQAAPAAPFANLKPNYATPRTSQGYQPTYQQAPASYPQPSGYYGITNPTLPTNQITPGTGHLTQPPMFNPHGIAPGKPKKIKGWVLGLIITWCAIIFGAAAFLISSVITTNAGPDAPVAYTPGTPPNWTAVTAAVKDSVVSITAGEWQGSGFVVGTEGLIVTNAHVVGTETEFTVTLADGRLFDAELIKADLITDTGFIRLLSPPADLQPVYLGDSARVQVGDPVLAIGNPRGLANTTTQGIVSAINRPSSTGSANFPSFVNAIQIDAAINPGNSGGPLFNAYGQVIGINYAGIGAEGSTGLNFAIPINLVRRIATSIIETGEVSHPFLGIEVEEARVIHEGQARLGAEIVEIIPVSPAVASGLAIGDVVVRLGDIEIDSPDALMSWLQQYEPGDNVNLIVVRDGRAHEVTATLNDRSIFIDEPLLSPLPGVWAFTDVYIPDWEEFQDTWGWDGYTQDEAQDELFETFLSDDWDSFTLLEDGSITDWVGDWTWDGGGAYVTWDASRNTEHPQVFDVKFTDSANNSEPMIVYLGGKYSQLLMSSGDRGGPLWVFTNTSDPRIIG